jgi:hypothetical protein
MTKISAATFKSALLALLLYCHSALSQRSDQVSSESGNTVYQHHILAIDEDGNAVVPVVTISTGGDGSRRYAARHVTLKDEDVREAKMKRDVLTAPSPLNERMQAALRGRRPLYEYLDAMFQDIQNSRPEEIIIYIHGGLNNIDSAIAKSALLTDTVALNHQYFIGICWNSNLMPNYGEHLLGIREGLHQGRKAILTSPAMLIADIGGAVARLPLNAASFLYQDIYTANPRAFTRRRLAERRYNQIRNSAKTMKLERLIVADAKDERPLSERVLADFGRWLVTYPVKLPSTFFLDVLGVQPWKNMVRRTRTMFERESEFIPQLDFDDAKDLATYVSRQPDGKPVTASQLLDQLNYTGRKGAMWHFCNYLVKGAAATPGFSPPTITLIGHSMGAIVGCEMLQRFHALPIQNVVFEAAACSVSDFKTKAIPYLEEQNLRAEMATRQDNYSSHIVKTQFYNLCLHDDAENSEKNPGELDLSQRGSLLTWVDTLYQSPESENDRTFGRWVNAILATDDFPSDILDRVTIKEFGRNRRRSLHSNVPPYTEVADAGARIAEPTKHGQMTRFEPGEKKQMSNFKFWSKEYRSREPDPTPAP